MVTGGTYRRPAQAAAGAWPAYWDGRWLVGDAGGASVHHALLMDPATEASGGQRPSRPTRWPRSSRTTSVDFGFGSDGALYASTATGAWRIAYTGGDDSPGPDPHYAIREGTTVVDFSAGRSGGVRVRVDLLRRRHRDRRERDARVRHRRRAAGHAHRRLRRRRAGQPDVHRPDPARLGRPRRTWRSPPPCRRCSASRSAPAPTFSPIIAGYRRHLHGHHDRDRALDGVRPGAARRRPQRGRAGPPGERHRRDAPGTCGRGRPVTGRTDRSPERR